MSQDPAASVRDRFNRIATGLTAAVGSPFALVTAVLIIVVWALTGPIFNFSETWQLLINTGTTIVTFLMVFVIQASQNRDSKALHLKPDEVIRAVDGARNEFITTEQSSEEQLQEREKELLEVAHNGHDSAPKGQPLLNGRRSTDRSSRASRRRAASVRASDRA